MMNRLSRGIILGLLLVCPGCAERKVGLQDGLKGTREGNYTLVAVADGLISFQIDARHKYQYYGSPEEISAAMPMLERAISIASNAGHTVFFMDARNRESNTASHGTALPRRP